MNSMDTTTVFGPPPVTPTNAFVAVDLEMMGLPENQIHRPKPSCFGLATFTIGGKCYICKTPAETQTALYNTNQSILVFHNAMFDITHLRSVANFPDRKKLFDTMLIERILFNGYYSGFGLEDLAARYLDVSMDKSGQKLWAKAKSWDDVTEDMVTYAADDGYITEKIAPLQKAKMTPNDINVWTNIDRPAMWAVQAMRGFPIDLPKFKALAETNMQESNLRDGQLSFNPRSPKQVIDHFYSEYKIKLSSSDEEAMTDLQSQLDEGKLKKKLKPDQIEQIKKELTLVAEGRFYRKMGSTYGTSILDIVEYEDDVPVVHGSYNISGAMTGRMCVHKDTEIPVHVDYGGESDIHTSFKISSSEFKKLVDEHRILVFTHKGRWKPVNKIFRKGWEQMYEVSTVYNETITCTPLHMFLCSDGNFRALREILFSTDWPPLIVSGVEKSPVLLEKVTYKGIYEVWDIEVEDDHSYYAQGFWNHNSCDSPNMQNIPARIGPVFRECFVPYPDEVLIVGDYSSQEPRITASYSDDPILLDIFMQDIDVYIEMGYMTYGERFDKKDVRRKYMKDMFLGMCYGLSKYGMAKKYGWSLDQAEKLINKTFQHFPTARKYIEKARKNRGFTLTKGGRRFWLNPYSNQVERHSLNAPIQGTASDQMKLALSRVYQNWPVDKGKFGAVAVVHDEMVCSVPKIHAPFFREYIENQMVRAASDICPGVPFKADVKICESWAEK